MHERACSDCVHLTRARARTHETFLFRLVHIVLLLRADAQDFLLARLLLVASDKELVQNVVRLQVSTRYSALLVMCRSHHMYPTCTL